MSYCRDRRNLFNSLTGYYAALLPTACSLADVDYPLATIAEEYSYKFLKTKQVDPLGSQRGTAEEFQDKHVGRERKHRTQV